MRIFQKIRKNIPKVAVAALLLTGLLAIAAPPVPAFAAKDTTIKATGDQSDVEAGGLPQANADNGTLDTVLRIVFGVIGAFAVLNITLSGLKYITSAGNEQKVAEAKNGIVYSLVGLAIAISAEAIVALVVTGASK
jgi:hypothetical protein